MPRRGAPTSISVVVCTFNGERFLGDQLASISQQTRTPDELVISDDGSTDRTLAIIDEFAANTAIPRVDVLKAMTPSGVTRNFEKAFQATRGEIVILADQDDIWSRERIEWAVEQFAEDDEAAVISCDAVLVDSRSANLGRTQFSSLNLGQRELELLNGKNALQALVRRNVLPGMTLAVRQEFLQDCLPIPTGWMHDYWLCALAGARGQLRVYGGRSLVFYRQHSSNVLGSRSGRHQDRIKRLLTSRPDPRERAEMFQKLLSRLLDSGETDPRHIALVKEKVAFEESRAAISKGVFRRFLDIAKIVAQGGFSKYSANGNLDAIREVIPTRWRQQSPPSSPEERLASTC